MKKAFGRQAALLSTWTIAIALIFLLLCFRRIAAEAKAQAQTNTASPTLASVFQPSKPLSPTHQVHLPVIDKTSPPITETLKTKYLFVEYWVHMEASQDCPWPAAMTSIPVYSFHSNSGVLIVFPPSLDLVLQADDMGYMGVGTSAGYWTGNSLRRFQETPVSRGEEMTLHTIDNAGFISLEYLSETITLAPRASWISSTISQTSEITTCFVTTTEHITNYAFQYRNKIEYYNLP